ncbi:unnamed protein product, partial [Mesorhabditis belari]|uniref:Uncharacterized protein n=1 Tax=Mesorhabditis belari TaxID=2138241 RepID=A0AAF3FCQ1_9BILA
MDRKTRSDGCPKPAERQGSAFLQQTSAFREHGAHDDQCSWLLEFKWTLQILSDIQASINANREKQLTFVEPKDIVRYTGKKLRRDMFHKSTISDGTMKGRKK